MRRALVLLVIAVLAAACGKKQAPASPQQPAADETKATEPPAGDQPDAGKDSAPTNLKSDPDDGGENQ